MHRCARSGVAPASFPSTRRRRQPSPPARAATCAAPCCGSHWCSALAEVGLASVWGRGGHEHSPAARRLRSHARGAGSRDAPAGPGRRARHRRPAGIEWCRPRGRAGALVTAARSWPSSRRRQPMPSDGSPTCSSSPTSRSRSTRSARRWARTSRTTRSRVSGSRRIEALLGGRLRILITTARAIAERTLVPASLEKQPHPDREGHPHPAPGAGAGPRGDGVHPRHDGHRGGGVLVTRRHPGCLRFRHGLGDAPRMVGRRGVVAARIRPHHPAVGRGTG